MKLPLPTTLLVLLLASAALAGCAGDDDGGDGGTDDTDGGTGGGSGTGTGGSDDDENTTTDDETEALAPLYVNETLEQGFVDCDAPEATLQFGAESFTLPAGAAGGSYELTVISSGEGTSGAGAVTASNMCTAFNDGPFGGAGSTSGTIPADADTIYVGVNQGYQVAFSIKIQPVPQEEGEEETA